MKREKGDGQKIFWLGVGEGQFNDMVSLFLIVE